MRVFWIVLLIFIGSCSPTKWAIEHRDKVCDMLNCCPVSGVKTNISITTDTTLKETYDYKTDSTGFYMYLRCDSNNKVLLDRVDQLHQQKDSIRTKLEANKLTVTGYYRDSLKTEKETIKEVKTRVDTITVRETVYKEKKVNHVPWYFWLIGGVALAGTFLLGIKL